jgi:hypothetical protein
MHRSGTCCVMLMLLAGAAICGCATGKASRMGGPPPVERKTNVVDYSSEGRLWFIGLNARVSRMSGPKELLPLQAVIVNKNAGPTRLTREGFVLETPDGKRLPVISYDQFDKEYSRDGEGLRGSLHDALPPTAVHLARARVLPPAQHCRRAA